MTHLPVSSHPVAAAGPVAVGAVLLAWAAAVAALAAGGIFVAEPAALPYAIMAAVALPPGAVLLAYRLSPAVRDWIAGLDLALVTAMQGWRTVGAAFLVLWWLGELPAVFAIPAGAGDVAVAIAALWAARAVARRDAGWRRRSGLLIAAGLADFAVAFAAAILSEPGRLLAFEGAPGPGLLQVLPLALIPGFLVPLFVALHLIAWIKLRTER